MESNGKQTITIQATIDAPLKKVWEFWTTPDYIIRWNAASHDWHTPWAENDLKVGGHFNFRIFMMPSKSINSLNIPLVMGEK